MTKECHRDWRVNMENSNKNVLQVEDDSQEMTDFMADSEIEETNSSVKKKQALNDQKRGKVRRSIEEIKERKRLQELLGDDYDDNDYLDS